MNFNSRLAIDDTGASPNPGTVMQQWDCNGSEQQNWTFTDAGDGAFTIANQLSKEALDDTGASQINGTKVQQFTKNGSLQQQWLLQANGSAFEIVNKLSGKAIDVSGGSMLDGTPLQQWSVNGSVQQIWNIVPAGSCRNSGFQILIDTNEMNLTEAQGDSVLSADGVWAAILNSGGETPPITQPADWINALNGMNGQSFAVTEDSFGAGYLDSSEVDSYIGKYNAGMVYHEENTPNGTVLLTSEIDSAYAATGHPILVLARTYSGSPAPYVRAALSDPRCSGVVFEQNPGYAQISKENLLQGIHDVLLGGKKVYFLLNPIGNSDFTTDVQSGVSQYLSQSSQLSNPNILIVLSLYGRNATGVGFLKPDFGNSGNSVLSAETWLKAYRMAAYGR